jgi:glycosyltransferase involved in cell wall biosynthesis
MGAKKKKACFFARVETPEVLKRRQWYENDIKILQELGFRVIVATKFNEIPFNCDLYFSWFATGSILPLIKAKISRKPIIVIAGGDEVVTTSYGYFSRPWFMRLVIRICLSQADAVLAVSESVLKEVKYLAARNPILVYNAIDINKFKPSNSKKDIIFSCARLDHGNYEGKKIEVLLRSIPHIIDQFPEQKFVIVGEKSDAYFKVKNLIEKLGCSGNINLVGAVPNSAGNYVQSWSRARSGWRLWYLC